MPWFVCFIFTIDSSVRGLAIFQRDNVNSGYTAGQTANFGTCQKYKSAITDRPNRLDSTFRSITFIVILIQFVDAPVA